MNILNLIKKQINPTIYNNINFEKRCSNCCYYSRKTNKYGICLNDKSNNKIKFVYTPNKKAVIMVPRFGICKYHNFEY